MRLKTRMITADERLGAALAERYSRCLPLTLLSFSRLNDDSLDGRLGWVRYDISE